LQTSIISLYEILATCCLLLSAFITIAVIKKNPGHICVPFLVMHLVFYFFPFYQFLDGGDIYYSIFSLYGVLPSTYQVAELLCFLAINFLLMSVCFYIFIPKFSPLFIQQQRISFKSLKIILIGVVIIFLLFEAFTNLDTYNLVYFFTPARKDIGLSGMERALLSIFPVLAAVILFNSPKSLLRFIPLLLCLLLIIFVLGQRRQIIMLLSFCIIYNYRNHIFLTKEHVIKVFSWLAGVAAMVIPISWYSRTYFTRMANDSWRDNNLLEIRSPLELLLGSSTNGFESLFLQQKYVQMGIIEPLHSTKFALFSLIPRALYPNKPMSIPASIASDAGTTGSTSTFFMSEIFTDYYLTMPLVSILFCYLYSKLDSIKTKGFPGFIFYILLWSNSVQLFKNGWASVFPFYVVGFALIFLFFNNIKRIKI
jgi:hypothetical protein